MLHTVFIAVHATAGALALVAGAVALRRGTLFGVYLWSMATMVIFLVLTMAIDWADVVTASRVVFVALGVLAVVMLRRAVLARRIRPAGAAGPSASYIDHVGFTLVALTDAFTVIAVLNAAPLWLVAASGVVVGVGGHFVLQTVRGRLMSITPLGAVAP